MSSVQLITAADVQSVLASAVIPVRGCRARSYVFASESDEATFMATASDDDVIAYASAIVIAEDGKVNKESAAKFAKNRGFLAGLMQKVYNKLKSPAGLLKLGAIAGAITLIGTALTLACKNPAQFGAISQKFADRASQWAAQVGQMAAKAINSAKQSGGRIKAWAATKLAGVVGKLKTLPALLKSAASRGAAAAKQGAQRAGQAVQHGARQAALRGGGALHRAGNAIQHGTNKASNAVFKSGLNLEDKSARLGQAVQRGSGIVQRAGQQAARTARQAGSGLINRAIPA